MLGLALLAHTLVTVQALTCGPALVAQRTRLGRCILNLIVGIDLRPGNQRHQQSVLARCFLEPFSFYKFDLRHPAIE
jgi:hypothetical protein